MTSRLALFALFLAVAYTTVPAADWQDLSSSTSLQDWKKVGGGATYEISEGVITGKTGPGKNTFLTRGPYADFVLEFEVKCDPKLNSGVQVRSHLYSEETPQESNPKRMREKGEMHGYQCEIRGAANPPHGCSGNFWDEGRRTRWLDSTVDAAEKQQAYRPGKWNSFRIIAQGNRIRSFVNGVPVADFTDDRDKSGIIGLQVHSIGKGAGPYQVQWRHLRIQELQPGDSLE